MVFIPLITKHKFNRDNVCEYCGIPQRYQYELQSEFCGMHECDRKTYEEVQVDHLTRDLKDLGENKCCRTT